MNAQLQEALAAIKAGNEERGRLLLARLLKDQPDNVAAWILLSQLAPSSLQKAAFLRKVLSIDPQNTYARRELAAVEAETAEAATISPATEPELDEERPATDSEHVAAEQPVQEEADTPETHPAVQEPVPTPPAGAKPVDAGSPAQEEPTTPEAHPVGQPTVEVAPSPEVDAVIETGEQAEPDVATTTNTSLPISEDPFDYEKQAQGDTLPPWLAEQEVTGDVAPGAPVEEVQEESVQEAEEPPPPDLPDWLAEETDATWLEQADAKKGETLWRAGERTTETSAAEAEAGSRPEDESKPEAARTYVLLLGLSLAAMLVFLLLVYAIIYFYF